MHQMSEPCLVQVARCDNNPPDNEELILDMEDVTIPVYIRQRMNDDDYLKACKEELDKFVNYEDNEIEQKLKEEIEKEYNHTA